MPFTKGTSGNKKGRAVSVKKNRIQASVVTGVQKPNVTRENINEKQRTLRWVPFFFGSNNIFINELALRKRRSPTHAAVLKAKLNFSLGGGFIFKKNDEEIELEGRAKEYVQEVNLDESLWDVYRKVQGDFIDFGNAYLEEVIEGKRTNLFHHDATTVRLNVQETTSFISNFWRDILLDENPSSQFPIKEGLKLFDPKAKQKRFLLHIKNYEPEFQTYGIPDHVAALKDADMEYKITTFNLSRLDNGLFPSVMIQLFGEPPEGKTAETYVKDIVAKFTGEGRNGKVFAELLDSKEQAANIKEFTQAGEGEFLPMKRLARENIIEAHRWHPSLMMQTPGKLSNKEEIRTAYEMVRNTVIPEYQRPVLRLFNNIFKTIPAMKDITLSIKNMAPVNLLDKIDVMKVWTIDELREETGKMALEEGGDELLKPGSVSIMSSEINANTQMTKIPEFTNGI